ncbi:ribonuclease H-like domain-containing protein [Tanacetum coccineum]|uniref:Ribonuclease H-like domain-containing protein n=1 Tax=Tanacetum coccineum TaxID=301880 RepID=A0ABQ5IAH7_9ASTR
MKGIKREFSVARTPHKWILKENRTLNRAEMDYATEFKMQQLPLNENTSNIAGSGPNWLFDIDELTNSINYKPVVARNQSNGNACTKAYDDAGKARIETVPGKDYILLPLWTQDLPFSSSPKDSPDVGFKPSGEEEKKDAEDPGNEGGNPSEEGERINQEKDASINNTNNINTVSPTINAASIEDNAVDENIVYRCANDPNIHDLEEISRFSDAEDDGAEADMTNLDTHILVYKNKKDESGIVIKNKERLVAQGYTQEEGIDYDEDFSLVSRIEAIREVNYVNMQRIIYKGWLEWNAKAAKDGIGVKTDMGEGLGQPTNPRHTSTSVQPSNEEPITIPSSSQPKKTHRPRKSKRATKISQSSGHLPLVADETITKEREDRMERAATTASRLEAEQGSGSGPRFNTLRSGEDRLKLKELMVLYTKLFDRVLDLETTKTAQAKEIASLKKRVKNLERKRKSKTLGMNLFKIGTSRRKFDMDEVFKDVEGDAEQVISNAADEVPIGDAINTAGTEVNTASAPVTTASVYVSTAEPITNASVNITTAEPITPPRTTTVFEDEDLIIA